MTESPLATACCVPLLDAPVTEADARRMAQVFKALSHPARLRVLSLIGARPEGEACSCQLVEPLGLSQPTVSHHLKVLHDTGLLARERRGSGCTTGSGPSNSPPCARCSIPRERG
ncbi:MAG TPA: metalloregulator ArsR/SmtB family transcription factor [Euzebyales bacterium]|nr:metalloregulator ArsR/SmtB family transcription factor [Euzebyales bacterium]